MNPEEPILPDPDAPGASPRDPVEEPPQIDDVPAYDVRGYRSPPGRPRFPSGVRGC